MNLPSARSSRAPRGSVAQCLPPSTSDAPSASASASALASAESATPSKSCILVFLQCRHREWHGNDQGEEAWAREAANRCLKQGFAVLRVPTESWDVVRHAHPNWFQPCFDSHLNRQHVICSINYIRVLCPILRKVHALLTSHEPADVKEFLSHNGYTILVPEGISKLSTDIYIVCEASSNVASNLTPESMRLIYGQYQEPVLWCGFNQEAQTTGSKGVVGDAASLLELGDCLKRLRLYHIDETYKALRSAFFAKVPKNHICFGYLEHRSQCCNSSLGDTQPMSEGSFTPVLRDIPDRLYHVEKKRFTTEQALMAALTVQTRCNSTDRNVLDIVCLRLWSYMDPKDPILVENNGAVKNQLETVRSAQLVRKAARDSQKLKSLMEGDDDVMKNDFAAAMGVITAGNETVHSKQEHEVMNFFRDEGVFVSESKKQWQALAMIERGLIMHADKPCLTCLHHPRQLWGFGACVSHFTETKGHKNEKPELDELATMLEKKHDDETADGTASLLHYFGDAVLNIMNRLNWRKGQKLGAHKPHDRAPAPVRTIFSPETQPEMFDRLAHTLGQAQLMKERGGDLQGRLKRDRTGKKIAEVPFRLAEISQSSLPLLTWHQIAQALVSITEYAFPKLDMCMCMMTSSTCKLSMTAAMKSFLGHLSIYNSQSSHVFPRTSRLEWPDQAKVKSGPRL